MATGIVEFNEARQLAAIDASYKGGPFFNSPNLAPSMNFTDGYPESVAAKLDSKPFKQGTPLDPWVYRYPNAKM